MTATLDQRLASDALESQQERRARLGMTGSPSQNSISNAVAGWMLRTVLKDEATLSYAQTTGLKECGVKDSSPQFSIQLSTTERCREIRNAMSTTTDTGGGYVVPSATVDRIERSLADNSALRDLGETIRVEHSGYETIPLVDDYTGAGELLEENLEATVEDFSIGAISPGFRRFSSKMLKVSEELMRDGLLSPERIMLVLTARVARKQNDYFTTHRVVPGIATGVTAASSTAIVYDELLDLMYSVDPVYRDSPTAAFMCHSNTCKLLAKLKDSTGQPIFKHGQNGGGWLLGKRVRCNNHWPTIATGVKAIAYGDWFAGVKVVDVREIRLAQSGERFAEYNQDGFVALLRSGCVVQTAGSPLLALTMV